jgi:hypothetical protein
LTLRNSTPSTQETSAEVKTRRKSDPAWRYCTQFTEGGRKKIKCMFCNDVFAGGGIRRFKEHLAKYPGNVAACKSVDPEVEHAMFQLLIIAYTIIYIYRFKVSVAGSICPIQNN